IDLFRARGRETALPDEPTAPPEAPARAERPEDRLERRRFAESLRDCAGQLTARDRTVWFFRVFYDLSSREIAGHPEVGLKAPHVDVILQRCRQAVRKCMDGKGYQPGDLPPGTFSELWAAFRAPASIPEKTDE
ncbi:MAG: hypothetical protein HKN12_03380, partial [Gemmatimonadetes bacterium]|nr:hypothetical protein [Gemmatimonadota bacterium]